jgi:hypothetical protein
MKCEQCGGNYYKDCLRCHMKKIKEEKEALYERAIKKKYGSFVDAKVTRIERIYVEEEVLKETEIKKNTDRETYSLSSIIQVGKDSGVDLSERDFEAFLSDSGIKGLRPIQQGFEGYKFTNVARKENIKTEYTEEEFNNIVKHQCIIEIEDAYKKAKTCPFHSEKCRCDRCPERDDSSDYSSSSDEYSSSSEEPSSSDKE